MNAHRALARALDPSLLTIAQGPDLACVVVARHSAQALEFVGGEQEHVAVTSRLLLLQVGADSHFLAGAFDFEIELTGIKGEAQQAAELTEGFDFVFAALAKN